MKVYLKTILDYLFYVLTSFFFIVVFILLITSDNKFLKWSIFDYANIKSEEYDWTVYPIEYVPNPFLLTYDQRKQDYAKIDSKDFIKTPVYDPNIFGRSTDSLKIWSKEYEQTVTQRLIFTIPYLSTYNFDYKEYTWSHPWIDIIAPKWTPVRNIASWVVVDVENNTSTFGNYILIRHDNVPLPNWKTWNIFSLYWHLNETYVKPWDKINKWFVIWSVWHSWIATTDHLHFQIDLDNAPFHPYWPFSANDMKKAWVNFFDAVNIWLWKEDAVNYTINPLDFVNKWLSFVKNIDVKEENFVKKEENQDVKPQEVKPQENEEKFLIPEQKPIILPDNKDDVILNSSNDDNSDIKLLRSDKDFMLLNNIETALNWNENSFPLNSAQSYNDNWLTASFEKLDNVDKNSIFSDIKTDYKYFDQLKYFKDNKIISWFEDNSFRPKNNLNRVEALKIILLWFWIKSQSSWTWTFDDVKANTWQNDYINSWIKYWIVSTKNKLFNPTNVITRVEIIKMISILSKADLWYFSKLDNKINDVNKDDWKYSYTNFAITNNLFVLDNWNFYPDKPITREELIFVLYKILNR